MAVFWVVVSCCLVEVYGRFRGACCLHHQDKTTRLHETTSWKTFSYALSSEFQISPGVAVIIKLNKCLLHLGVTVTLLSVYIQHVILFYIIYTQVGCMFQDNSPIIRPSLPFAACPPTFSTVPLRSRNIFTNQLTKVTYYIAVLLRIRTCSCILQHLIAITSNVLHKLRV
jgi:hypothetical protein